MEPTVETSTTIKLAQRLQALAQTGLTFATDPFDIERYEEISRISAQLMCVGDDAELEGFAKSFRDQIGYATPKVDVRALVIRGDTILLIKEASDGLWSLPGGWADVGDTPAQAVAREVREESGLEVTVDRLLGVWDRNLHGHPPHPFHIYKLIFHCTEYGGALQTSKESLEVGFFDIKSLPPLSLTRIVPTQIEKCLAILTEGRETYFD